MLEDTLSARTPPVVLTSSGVTLAERMRLSELPLATTPGGKVFALKALHPSEHTIKSTRVPGGNRMSVAINCDMVQTINIPETNMMATIALSPNIFCPATVVIERKSGSNRIHQAGNFYNSAFGGAYQTNPTYINTSNMVATIRSRVSSYRITSQSATVELVAPALSDQGTITASQYSIPPRTVTWGGAGPLTEMISSYAFGVDGFSYSLPIQPSQSLLGTSAYTSSAREGCYMPLKLTDFDFKDMNDLCFVGAIESDSPGTHPVLYSKPFAETILFPYYENRTGSTASSCAYVPKFCGHNFGVIFVEGTAANVALRIRVRQVIEVTSLPGGTYAPIMEMPLPPDPVALRMYMEISGKMKDAYPASWNHLGKLKEIVLKVGKQLLPYVEPALAMLSSIPGPVGTVAKGAQTVVNVGKAVHSAVKETKKKKKTAKSASN